MPDPMEMVSVRYLVDDVAASIDFYTGVLGFEVLNDFAPAFADVARGGCGCSSADRRARQADRCPTGCSPGRGDGIAST